MTTPTLSTSRLSLRPLIKATARQLEWLRNPEVVRYSEQRHQTHTPSSQLTYIKSFGGKSHIWAIHEVDDGEHIGNLTATHDGPNDVADVGIMIGEAQLWGHGYATEAMRVACDWLLDRSGGGIRKLEGGCYKPNAGMLSVFRKSGFKLECERPAHHLLGGGQVAAMYFGRSR